MNGPLEEYFIWILPQFLQKSTEDQTETNRPKTETEDMRRRKETSERKMNGKENTRENQERGRQDKNGEGKTEERKWKGRQDGVREE